MPPLLEQARVGVAYQLAQVGEHGVERVGLAGVGHRALERAQRLAQIAQEQAFAALDAEPAHRVVEALVGFEHLAHDALRVNRRLRHPGVSLGEDLEGGAHELGLGCGQVSSSSFAMRSS
jgi:hypothetical protein